VFPTKLGWRGLSVINLVGIKEHSVFSAASQWPAAREQRADDERRVSGEQ
jgi:hypothetical protein